MFELENYYIKHPDKCVLPSIFKSHMKGVVTHIHHPSKFFIRPIGKHYDAVNADLIERIQLSVQSLRHLERGHEISNNARVIVKSKSGEYVRGLIVQPTKLEDNPSYFEVSLIDSGKVEIFKYDCIFPENSMTDATEIFDIPPRVFECILSQIQPSFINCPKGKWTLAAIEEFKKVAYENAIVSFDVYSLVNDIASVELTVMPDVNVNQHLMNQGFAQTAEENYMSKVSIFFINFLLSYIEDVLKNLNFLTPLTSCPDLYGFV